MRSRLFHFLLLLLATAFCWSSSALAVKPAKYSAVRIHINKPKIGDLNNAIIQLGSREGRAIIIGTCAAFGGDCSKPAAGLGIAAEILRSKISDNEASAIINAPAGYTICNAKLTERRHDSGTTFNGSYSKNTKSLSLYMDVPTRRGKSKAIDYTVHLMFVRARDRKAYNCEAPGRAFACPGNWCCNPRPINRPGTCRQY